MRGSGFHLLIKITINGKAAKMIVDTGASITVFDKTKMGNFVKEKKIEERSEMTSGLGTNTMKVHGVMIKKMMVGKLEIKNYKAVLVDLSHVNDSYNKLGMAEIDGVLGSDIFRKYKAVIDYEKKTLTLKSKK